MAFIRRVDEVRYFNFDSLIIRRISKPPLFAAHKKFINVELYRISNSNSIDALRRSIKSLYNHSNTMISAQIFQFLIHIR